MAIFNSYVKLPEGRPWLVGGWPTHLKNDGVKVRLDHHLNENGENKIHVPVTTNQMIKFWVSPTFQSPDVHLTSATSAP